MDPQTKLLFANAAYKYESKIRVHMESGEELKGRVVTIVDDKYLIMKRSPLSFFSSKFMIELRDVNYLSPDY